ncbi:MAG: helix-turn-helix transcriptional regulator [Ketobacter sp.]|nr:helix-turn-helix transcriptional regulator [Ketobacter sp.]
MQYGQFCPISKAAEVLGDKWSLLIVRELLMGSTRFNNLLRGLSSISPTMLTKRLNELCIAGIVLRKKIPGQKGYEYFVTQSGQELVPVLKALGAWGMRWAREGMPDADLDVELLMLYMERSVDPRQLVGNETVIRFKFTDLEEFKDWWVVVKNEQVDTCVHDPGKDVDVYFTTDLRTMIQAWMGDISYKQAISDKRLLLVGQSALTKNISRWLRPSIFDGIPPADEIRHDSMMGAGI